MGHPAATSPLCIWQLTKRGFCSELNLLLLAILYCKEEGLDFALASRRWNSAYKIGWRDYFEPFSDEVDSSIYLLDNIRPKHTSLRKALHSIQRAAFRRIFGREILINGDIWDRIWTHTFAQRHFDCFGARVDCFDACRMVLADIWKFNADTQRHVSELIRSIHPEGQQYFTIHVRRGDKIEEAEYVSLSKYMECAHRAGATSMCNCHVMSDDYRIIEKMRKQFSQLNIITLCDSTSRGHAQKTFNNSNSNTRRMSTIAFLAELTMAAEAEFFVGTYTSNIARFVALLRGRETTHSVDIPFTMLR